MPRVSVVIPTFNLAGFIERALNSALAQTYSDYESIVVDDGSTDDTREVVARCGGKVQYLSQANRGVAAARNLAISKASGELIAYLDADDMWYPHKLERQVAFLDAHPECGVVHSDFSVIDEADTVLHSAFNQEKRREVPQGSCAKELLQRCHIQPLTVMERRECVERTQGFDERLKGVDDYLRWILLSMQGVSFGYIAEPLAMYRWRGDRFTVRHRRTYAEAFATLFEILLHEKGLAARCGGDAAEIIRERLFQTRREVAYLDRLEGRPERARRCLVSLIKERPTDGRLYLDLVKAWIPPALAGSLRRMRGHTS